MNNKANIDKEKEEYMNIKASDELRSRISGIFQESYENEAKDDILAENSENIQKSEKTNTIVFPFMKSKSLRIVVGTAAAFTILFSSALNFDKSFADRVSDIPGMEGIVKVLTFGRYSYDEGNISASIKTPKVSGLVDEALQGKLNEEFKEHSATIISAFEAEVQKMKKDYPQAYLGVDAGYRVVTNTDKYLTINLYSMRTEGSAYEENNYITVDKMSNKVIELKDMFAEDVDYITPISKYIREKMKFENDKKDGSYWIEKDDPDRFEKISKDQSFYINQEGNIVISFNEGDVAASSMGEVTFIIPRTVIEY